MSQSSDTKFPAPRGTQELEHGDVFTPKFDDQGLIPAIVTSSKDGAVLMFAWMNEDALWQTLETRQAHFWSRSRGKLWRKGEDSGNTLAVTDIRTDCDQDVVWLICDIAGDGKACHTGARSCFYRTISTPSKSKQSVKLTTRDL